MEASTLGNYQFETSEVNKDYVVTEEGEPVQLYNNLYHLKMK